MSTINDRLTEVQNSLINEVTGLNKNKLFQEAQHVQSLVTQVESTKDALNNLSQRRKNRAV